MKQEIKIKSRFLMKAFDNDLIVKIFKKHKVKYSLINGEYDWFIDEITEEVLNEINRKKKFIDLNDFKENGYPKLIQLQEEYTKKEEKKRKEREIIENEKKLEEERRIKLEQTAIDNIASLVENHYKNFWFDKRLEQTRYIIHVGPTNSGKTYKAIQRLVEIGREDGSGVYLAPLRLLAHEVYEKLSEQLSIEKTELRTGEHIIENETGNKNIISSRTIEMMDDEFYDVVVIDECFMIADNQRGASWVRAIASAKAGEVHLISSLESLEIIKKLLTRLNRSFEVNEYERKTPLIMNPTPYDLSKKILDRSVFIVFSRRSVLYQKYLFEKKGCNVSVIYGNLPPEVKNEQIKKFISGENNVCISTDAIGMGMNIPCDHICFLEIEKFDGTDSRVLNSIEIKQIAGRAGRFGLSTEGIVYGANKPIHQIVDRGLKQQHNTINSCYVGVNFNFLKTLPQKRMIEKLWFYKKLNVIPKELSDFVFLENVEKYIDLSHHESIDSVEIEYAWALLNLPVHHENVFFWRKIVDFIKNQKMISFEIQFGKTYKIKDGEALKDCELYVFKLDMLISLSNNKHLSEFIDNELVDKIKESKESVVEKINKFILDKNLSSVKKCASCGKNVGIDWNHAKCNDCFRSERRFYDSW